MIKDEALVCVIDEDKNKEIGPNDSQVLILAGLVIPTIENSLFDIDYNSLKALPNGAQTYEGLFLKTKENIEVIIYPAEILQYVSADSKNLKYHL